MSSSQQLQLFLQRFKFGMSSPLPARAQEQKSVVVMQSNERAILDRQLHGLPDLKHGRDAKPSIQRYASMTDRVVLSVGAICALIAGALNPLVPVRCANTNPDRNNCPHSRANLCVLLKGYLWPARRCL